MPLLQLGRDAGSQNRFPFDAPKPSYWYNGRVAIYQGLQALHLPPDRPVLMPAYHCGSEVDAVLKTGLPIEFYRIGQDLCADIDHIRELVESTGASAIFVTHYFGFPQPLEAILELAQRRDLRVIEDNAHGLYSRDSHDRALGSRGDIGVFSLVKTLPIADGGVLVINRSGVDFEPDSVAQQPAWRPVAGKIKFQAERLCASRFPRFTAGLKRLLLDPLTRLLKSGAGRQAQAGAGQQAQQPAVEDNDDSVYRLIQLQPARKCWRMSSASSWLMRHSRQRHIVSARRQNYLRLLAALGDVDGLRFLFPTLPDGCCPLFLPIQVEDAPGLQRELAKRGIGCKLFWSFFHERLPRADFELESRLKQSVIALPVHQSLRPGDLDKIATAVEDCLAEHERSSAGTK